jgi:hypothetical protein
MKRAIGTWLALGLVFAMSACEDEILTDVDLPKDASADRGSDAPKEGATSDAPATNDAPATDAGADENAEDDGATAEAGDATADASDGTVEAALDGPSQGD